MQVGWVAPDYWHCGQERRGYISGRLAKSCACLILVASFCWPRRSNAEQLRAKNDHGTALGNLREKAHVDGGIASTSINVKANITLALSSFSFCGETGGYQQINVHSHWLGNSCPNIHD